MKLYIDIVLIAVIFLAFNGMADTSPKINNLNVECKAHFFVGGPLAANFTVRDKLASFELSFPVGEGKFKRPAFGEFDNLLQIIGKIEKEEFVESFTLSNFDASKCSNAANLPTLIGCGNFKQSPLLLLVRNRDNNLSREISLQTESASFFSARRVYEQASGKEIHQYISYTVGINFEFKSTANKYYYPKILKTFYGEDGCVSR